MLVCHAGRPRRLERARCATDPARHRARAGHRSRVRSAPGADPARVLDAAGARSRAHSAGPRERCGVEETSGATGISVSPNPHASLYVHVLEQVTGEPLAPGPLQRDGDVIRLGIETFVRLLPLLFQEGVHAQWTAAAREIVRASDA